MPDFSPTEYAVPGFVLLVLIEMIWAWRRRPDAYEPRDTLTSLAFGLGSTVILFLPPGDFTWELTPGASVKMGQPIGRWG